MTGHYLNKVKLSFNYFIIFFIRLTLLFSKMQTLNAKNLSDVFFNHLEGYCII